jgi:peptidoglycan/xylan/chitin deacetylase (PgdA/CDA1 family)
MLYGLTAFPQRSDKPLAAPLGTFMPALILMYHDIAETLQSIAPGHRPYVLDPKVFRRQMRAIVDSDLPNFIVGDWCASSRQVRAVVLTFDDGHSSNYDTALPILLDHRLKATFFITAGWVGVGSTMDWCQIRALHAAGMEIGSHTLTHRPPSTLDEKELRYELSESRRVLEDGLGAEVTSLSSPTGFFNSRMRKIAQEVGYRSLCNGRVGLATDYGDPFSLNRVAVKRSMTENQFKQLLNLNCMTIGSLRSRQWTRDLARKIIGAHGYTHMRRVLMKRLAQV